MKNITKLSLPLVMLSALSTGNVLAQSDELMRDLFQDLKNYIGLTVADDREYESRLRAVPPTYYELSAASGNYVIAAEETKGMHDLQDFLMGRLIDWNMLQDKETVNDSHLVEQHLLGFCSEQEANPTDPASKLCNNGLTIQQGGAADLLIDTLLTNDTLTESQQTAVWAFIDNLTNPVPVALAPEMFYSEELSESIPTLKGSPMAQHFDNVKIRPLSTEGIRGLAARYKQMAFLSTAQNALNEIAADRHVVKDLGSKIGMKQNDASIFAAYKFEANRRFGDLNWHNDMYTKPTEALLREIANMQAFQLALDFKRYQQEQTMTSLLAAQIAYFSQQMGQGETAMQSQAEIQ